MMVSYVHKIKGEDVVTSMTGSRLGFFQNVDIEDGKEPSPDGKENGVEGDVPSTTSQVCVEGVLDQWLLVPLHSLGLQTEAP